MSEEQTAKIAPAPSRGARTRVSTENRYPVYNLKDSLLVAQEVKNQGGNACSAEQLGAFLGYKNTTGGAFVSRVAAAKQFGLIETVLGRYQITKRAEAALFPVTPESRLRALRDAFLAIGVYRQIYEQHTGLQLPEEFGMLNLLKTRFGIPPDRAHLAYRVMMESAESAGFFNSRQGSRTHLVDPMPGAAPIMSASPAEPSTGRRNEPFENRGGSGGGRGGGGEELDLDPALVGLLRKLPKPGQFPRRNTWEAAWKATMDVLYGDDIDGEGDTS